ncbi:MAG: hypothetical protein LWX70_10065 [Sphingobacteriia bacterium]|nr:hypothetical protein [Sphingobacteriia bacterium]
MSISIGIRHEDKYAMERRSPLSPVHVRRLINNQHLDVFVQRSDKRVWSNEEYHNAGAVLTDNLDKTNVIFGVKEIPIKHFEHSKTYVFFSHVVKGQSYNMPMLKALMDKGCTLIDYERIVDDMNRRIIFFGRFAGLAGMINTLWTLGLRLKEYNIDTPFLKIRQAYTYSSLEEARAAVADVGLEIAENGLPSELQPFVVGITGYGNVSQGVQEILGLLPVKEIMVNRLTELRSRKSAPTNLIYKVIFKQQDLVKHTNPNLPFDLHDYYQHPHNYLNDFEQYIPHLSTLVNGMYWDDKFPKLITRKYLQENMRDGKLEKLHVIGDITCDPEGSIDATLKGSTIEQPLYVYNPENHTIKSGFSSEGLQIMAVDILPSELPRESSEAFGNVLFNFVKPIAAADYSRSYDEIDLPRPIKRAMIVHNGELTPSYKYLEKYL